MPFFKGRHGSLKQGVPVVGFNYCIFPCIRRVWGLICSDYSILTRISNLESACTVSQHTITIMPQLKSICSVGSIHNLITFGNNTFIYELYLCFHHIFNFIYYVSNFKDLHRGSPFLFYNQGLSVAFYSWSEWKLRSTGKLITLIVKNFQYMNII